jgi:hypothetical protein
MELKTLDFVEVSNQCVVVCDLERWSDAHSPAWEAVRGTQDEVGASLAALLNRTAATRLEDFGGVCRTFLCDGEEYLQSPPRIAGRAGVFSFTPRKKLLAEGQEMARAAQRAGYLFLVLTLQKHDKFGKVWVLAGLLRHLTRVPLTYYEDTNTVIDELKTQPAAERIAAVHVQAPGFEGHLASLIAS